jgi:catechol 2,3-dioxygenase-like lactoylglutathione lyase family enzyme
MIDHVEILVGDLARSAEFFRTALAPLGYDRRVDGTPTGFGASSDALDFWLRGGGPSTPRPHLAFQCATRADVDAAYDAALRAGGGNDRAPALLPQIHPDYYAAFVRDPDGHNIEFVCHRSAG